MIPVLAILLGSILVGVTAAYSVALGIAPTPTSQAVRKALQEALPTRSVGTVYELGSGWGTLLAPLKRRYPQGKVVGYELSPLPYLISRLRRLPVRSRNFLNVPLSDAGLIVCYLYPGAMQRLEEKFLRELSPGTLVISHTFALPHRRPGRISYANDLYATPIYQYEF